MPENPEIQKAVDTLRHNIKEVVDEATSDCIRRSDLEGIHGDDDSPLPEDASIAEVVDYNAARNREALGRLGSYRLGSSWKQESPQVWTSQLDFGRIRGHMAANRINKSLTNYTSLSTGAGVGGARENEIWQHRPETLEMLIDMIPMVPVNMDDGAAKSLEISGLDHRIIADNADPTAVGTSAESSHVIPTRKSQVKIGTATQRDIPGLQGKLEILIYQIVAAEMLKSLVAELKTATSDSDAVKIKTEDADAIPTPANIPGKLVDLFLSLSPQYWNDSILLSRGEITQGFVNWSLSAASQRGFSDLVNGVAGRSMYQRAFSSNQLDDGTTLNDVSAFVFSPAIVRIFMKNMIESRFALDPATDAWFLTVESRYKLAVLDRQGLSYLATEA